MAESLTQTARQISNHYGDSVEADVCDEADDASPFSSPVLRIRSASSAPWPVYEDGLRMISAEPCDEDDFGMVAFFRVSA